MPIIDLDSYKDFIEQYKIDVETSKTLIDNCIFKSNFRYGSKSEENISFNFKLEHKLENYSYNMTLVNFAFCAYKVVYNFYDNLNRFNYRHESKHFLSFKEISEIFLTEGMSESELNKIGIPMGFNFGEKYSEIKFDDYKSYFYKNKHIEYTTNYYGDNSITAFKTGFYDHAITMSCIKYFFHVKYNGMWFKIISSNISESIGTVEMLLMNYDGNFLNPENINTSRIIKNFKWQDIPELFEEDSFNKIMSKVETEIIFS